MENVELQIHSAKFPIEQNGSRDRLVTSSVSASADGLDNPSMEDPYSIYRGSFRGTNGWHSSGHLVSNCTTVGVTTTPTSAGQSGAGGTMTGPGPTMAPGGVDSAHVRSTCHRMFERSEWVRGSRTSQQQQVFNHHQHQQQQQQQYFQQQSAEQMNGLLTTSQASPQLNGKPVNSFTEASMTADGVDKNRNGTLSKKYYHIKDMISNRFNKSSNQDLAKNPELQNNRHATNINNNSRHNSINSSFRKAIQRSSQKSNLNGEVNSSAPLSESAHDRSVNGGIPIGVQGVPDQQHSALPRLPQHPPPTTPKMGYPVSDLSNRASHVHPPVYSAPPPPVIYGIVTNGRYANNSNDATTNSPQRQNQNFGVRGQHSIYGPIAEGSPMHWSPSGSSSRPATSPAAQTDQPSSHCSASLSLTNGSTRTAPEPLYVTRRDLGVPVSAAVVTRSPFLQRTSGSQPVGFTGTPVKQGGTPTKALPDFSNCAVNLNSSLDSASTSQRSRPNNFAGHSSGNDSEWIDMGEADVHQMTHAGVSGKENSGTARGSCCTPPLPALSLNNSPGDSPSNPVTPRLTAKFASGHCHSPSALTSQPDIIGTTSVKTNHQHVLNRPTPANKNSSTTNSAPLYARWIPHAERESSAVRSVDAPPQTEHHMPTEGRRHCVRRLASVSSTGAVDGMTTADGASVNTALQDVESILDHTTDLSTEDEEDDDEERCPVLENTSDGLAIRKQLESLETMYSEVLRLLGGQRRAPGLQSRANRSQLQAGGGGASTLAGGARHRVYGSLSSLPSSVTGGPTARYNTRDRRRDDKRKGREMKGVNKRFQRLESHVVTLARSVAHLSSEIRTQHALFQELENIRAELGQLRSAPVRQVGSPGRQANSEWDSFRDSIPSLTHPGRVRKLTKFFGDEPPLLRIFLRKLGYEKFACLFEREKIGMIELPYMTEERLQKLGIPVGPRLRILQEAQMSLRNDNFNVYIL